MDSFPVLTQASDLQYKNYKYLESQHKKFKNLLSLTKKFHDSIAKHTTDDNLWRNIGSTIYKL